jgi:hypothetical protein
MDVVDVDPLSSWSLTFVTTCALPHFMYRGVVSQRMNELASSTRRLQHDTSTHPVKSLSSDARFEMQVHDVTQQKQGNNRLNSHPQRGIHTGRLSEYLSARVNSPKAASEMSTRIY